MRFTLVRLAIGMQAVLHLVQDASDTLSTDPVAFFSQKIGDIAYTLASPAQGAFRIASGIRLNNLFDNLPNLRISLDQPLASAALMPDPAWCRVSALVFTYTSRQ